MYSVVLMAALTTGGSAPDCHFGHHGGGCYCSCYGGCYGGCHGGWYGGCHGCWYGGCHGCHGYWGYDCHGCYGWAYGCHGCYGSYSCSSCYGCYGCSCYGGYSPWGGMGVPYGYSDGVPAGPAAPGAGTGGDGSELPPPTEKKGKKGPDTSARANLTVVLPADATLYVDGAPVKAKSASRRFVTPPLEPGRAYYYDLRAEVVRDGQRVTINRRVVVRPGESVSAAFPELQQPATSTVRFEGE